MQELLDFKKAQEDLVKITGGRSGAIEVLDETWFYFPDPSTHEFYMIQDECETMEEAKQKCKQLECVEYFCERKYAESNGLVAFDLRLSDNHLWGDTIHCVFLSKNQVVIDQDDDSEESGDE